MLRYRIAVVVCVAAGVLTSASNSLGVSKQWTGSGTDYWSVPGNWNPAGVPVNGDDVSIVPNFPFTPYVPVTVNYDYTGAAVTLSSLEIDATGGVPPSALTFQMDANSLTSTLEYVGYSAAATFTQTGGTNLATTMKVAYLPQSRGTYNLSGGWFQTGTGGESIGGDGVGIFNQTGGIHVANSLLVGEDAIATGTYNLSGKGSFQTAGEIVGYAGTGTFNQNGGTNSFSQLRVGYLLGSHGVYNLRDGTLSGSGYSSKESIGGDGVGVFNQSGGMHNGATIFIGEDAGSTGSYYLSGGSLSGGVYVGYQGEGDFEQTGGTNSATMYVGYNSGSIGSYSLHAGSLTGSIFAGGGTGSIGNVTMDGGTFSGFMNIGGSSSGTFKQSGGTSVITTLYLGTGNGGRGTFELYGGSASVTESVSCGLSGAGLIWVGPEATLSISGALIVTNTLDSSVKLDGGSINAGRLVDQTVLTVNRGTVTVGNTTLFNTSAVTMGLGGTVRGSDYGVVSSNGRDVLAGALTVSLLDGYMPVNGDSFDIFDWGTLTGTFSSVQLPALSTGLFWDSSQLYTTGTISVNRAGDYNRDGVINTLDYVVYADQYATIVPACSGADGNCNGFVERGDYDAWRVNFGLTVSGGATLLGDAKVPEPASGWLAILAVALVPTRNRRLA